MLIDCRYRQIGKPIDYSITELEAVHGSGPVDLWFNERLRKENRMGSNETDMFDGWLC